MNPAGNDPLDLATVNGMMNLCEAREQARLDEAAALTEPEQRKAAYARRLREYYAREGVTMSEEAIQKAVEDYLENELTFQEPRGGFGVVLAALYIHRIVVVSLLALFFVIAVAAVSVELIVLDQHRQQAWRQATGALAAVDSELTSVQSAVVAGETAQQADTRNRAEQLAAKTLPESLRNPQAAWEQEIAKQFSIAGHALTLAREEAGACENQVTGAKDYRAKTTVEWNRLSRQVAEVRGQLDPQLAQARTALAAAQEVGGTQRRFDAWGRQWLGLSGQLTELPPKWKTVAETSLALAATELAQGDTTVQSTLAAAQSAIAEGGNWAALELAAKMELAASRDCQTHEPSAEQALTQAQTSLQQALAELDLENIPKATRQLKEIVAQINQAYEVRIVCRTGYRTVIQRTEHDSHANRYYAIVESVNPHGEQIKRRIQNRENGAFFETAVWGQEIPQTLYQSLYTEKKTTGAIQDLTFGRKEPGYLNPRFTKAPESQHEITHW
ncbi:MAG TPA: DUF6384 family protein [Verrucomicrobiae bacterium]